ncbi:hypothetical protein AUR64_17865 [Haloprofundus marisrubri]|uniref:Cupin type-2 domain-containing protein n=1 Tax=Haloprofundus marisrubri TaxID=1514971 RepID=A0A0W1R648_9EURY|nr:cupin domain-containing protein [Haloprofundus marisrubri]KTG08543.1 hypothetical protein AUR64_17865 [Haloprofundus marisrubri]
MDTKASHPQPWMKGPRDGEPYWSLGGLTVLRATDENTGGSFSMIEEWIPAGSSPPRHLHRHDDEMFHVLDGAVTFEVGDEQFTATAGSTVYAPHGVAHTYFTHEEIHWLMFVHEPGLERLWASVGRPAESWEISDDSEVDEQMERVFEQLDRYEIELVGDPLTPEEIRT